MWTAEGQLQSGSFQRILRRRSLSSGTECEINQYSYSADPDGATMKVMELGVEEL